MSRLPAHPRPLSRPQILENEAFLAELRRTGSVRDAARKVGFPRGRFIIRRAKHPGFALQWEQALAFADAALAPVKAARKVARPGTPVITRRNGRLQLRAAIPGEIDRAARQRFLLALSATCNIALSAAAAGFTSSAFFRHKHADPGFAREWRLALERGYEALEAALLEGWSIEGHQHDGWHHNEPPAIPRMSPDQALQLLYLHQKEARLGGTPEPLRRRRGESEEARRERLTLMSEHRCAREREAFDIAEAERRAQGKTTRADMLVGGQPVAVALPDLAQVQASIDTANRVRREAGGARAGKGSFAE